VTGLLSPDIPSVALPFFNGRFGRSVAVRRQGATNIHFLLELAFLIAAHIAAVPALWFDYRALACVSCCHTKSIARHDPGACVEVRAALIDLWQ